MSIFGCFEHVIVVEILKVVDAAHLYKHIGGLLVLGYVNLDHSVDKRLLSFGIEPERFKVGELGEETNSPSFDNEVGLLSLQVLLDDLDQRLNLDVPLVSQPNFKDLIDGILLYLRVYVAALELLIL